MKLHIVLTKKDADIAAFKKSLSKGEWSKTVVQIMNAAIRDRVADIPMNFAIEPLDEKVDTKISMPQKLADRFCEKFGHEKGELGPGIKTQIRKCIRKNLKQRTVKRFSSADIQAAFDQAFRHVSEKGEALDGRRDKCERLQREYHRAFQIKHDALLLKIRKETEK